MGKPKCRKCKGSFDRANGETICQYCASIRKIKPNWEVYIPVYIHKKLGLKRGQSVFITEQHGDIIIKTSIPERKA